MQNTTLFQMGRVLLFALFLLPTFASATTYTYQGFSGGGMWDDASVWSPAGIPGAGDDVIISATASDILGISRDVTVKSLTINGIGAIYGEGRLTITERLDSRYALSWQVSLVIAAGAQATMDDSAFSTIYTGLYFYKDLIVNGNLVANAQFLNSPQTVINGTLTQLRGDLVGGYLINPGGVLNINSPNKAVQMGSIVNNGTFNWQRGRLIASNTSIVNTGVWNITASNDSLITETLFPEGTILNTGTIQVGPDVVSSALLKAMRNEGSIVMAGPSMLSLYALDHRGSISGPSGSTIEMSGYYFNAGSTFRTGSTVNVSTFKTAYSSSIIIESGVDISNISNFYWERGLVTLGVVLPPAATYDIQSNAETTVDQTFTGQVKIWGGGFSGPHTITFSTPNATIRSTVFDKSKVIISQGAVVAISSINVADLTNNGTVNWDEVGEVFTGLPGITNNSVWNISADSVSSNSWDQTGVPAWRNNGTLNLNGRIASLFTGVRNDGSILVGANSTLQLGGALEQNNVLSGGAGSILRLYGWSGNGSNFRPNAQTTGFSLIEGLYAKSNFLAGTILSGISQFKWFNSEVESGMVLPPASKYYFNTSTLRLKTIFDPTTSLELVDANIEGSGSLRIKNNLDWNGGTLDVPVRIYETATASIRENKERPIISAPFTNEGNITLSGGIIEINTGFFKNSGTWNVDSDDDVIMDGFTSFTNDGLFSICGSQPIRISFNVPFINAGTGTFKGQGAYVFNAGFTNQGTVAPGCSPGILTIEDDFDVAKGIDLEVQGGNAGQYDQLIVNGDMTASGVLNVIVPTGTILNGTIKVIQTSGTFSGTFNQVNLPANFTLKYESDGVSLTSNGTVSTQLPDQQENIVLSPTLVTDEIRISNANPSREESRIEIYNLNGQLVSSAKVAAGADTQIVITTDLPTGTYVVRLVNTPNWRGRFVKM